MNNSTCNNDWLPKDEMVTPCSDQYRKQSLREMIQRHKNNMYSGPLKDRKITFTDTGETYTLEELDEMINN